MTTAGPDTERPTSAARCGCCGRAVHASRLTELGSTPGVFICTSCALWAARRSSNLRSCASTPDSLPGGLRHRIARTAGPATIAIPILYSTDLDRTATYYRALASR